MAPPDCFGSNLNGILSARRLFCLPHQLACFLLVNLCNIKQRTTMMTSAYTDYRAKRLRVFCRNINIKSSGDAEIKKTRSSPQWWSRPLDDPTWCAQSADRQFAIPPFGIRGSQGWAHSIARPWVPTSSPLTCMLSLSGFELFSWLQKRFHPSGRRTRIPW